MITALLTAILVFEIVRLWLYLLDSRRINRVNKEASARQDKAIALEKQRDEDWKLLRRAELEELSILAKDSDTMKQIFKEYVEKMTK